MKYYLLIDFCLYLSLIMLGNLNELALAASFDNLKNEMEIMTIIDKNPDNSLLYKKLGNLYMKQGKFDSAISQFKIALDKGHFSPDLYANLAGCQQQLGDYEGAKQSLIQYIIKFPQNPEAYLAIGTLYEKIGQKENAEEVYKIYKNLISK